MTRIIIEEEPMTLGRLQELKELLNKFFANDLHVLPDSLTGAVTIASDEHLHIKRSVPITEEPEVIEALEVVRVAKESSCNTFWDSMEIRELQ